MLATIPGFFWYPIALAAVLLIVFGVREWKRRTGQTRAQVRNFPTEWLSYLEANVPLYKKMPLDLREDYQDKVWRFIEQKRFVPCGELEELTDEMRVTIAGNACILLLNRDVQYCFPKVFTVLVYPTAFFSAAAEEEELLLGEAWPTGTVILAWDAARKSSRSLRDGKNLILHEFTHQLDMEAGCDANGCPALDGFQHRVWAGVMQREYDAFNDRLRRGKRPTLDTYGSAHPAEFFAVATETFFERPHRLQKHHPEVYEQLRLFYRVDPARWNEHGVGACKEDL
jgi:hypothetical protein